MREGDKKIMFLFLITTYSLIAKSILFSYHKMTKVFMKFFKRELVKSGIICFYKNFAFYCCSKIDIVPMFQNFSKGIFHEKKI